MRNEKEIQLKLFGDHLKKLRKEKSLSQKDLSDICKLDTSKLSKIENGKINITMSTLTEIATALDEPLYILTDFYDKCIVSGKEH